jgi:hypothetical protein
MKNKIYLYLSEKVTIRYRNGQIRFSLKMLGENPIDLYVYTDRMISIEGLLFISIKTIIDTLAICNTMSKY